MSERAGQHWDEDRQAWMWNRPDDGSARIAELEAELAEIKSRKVFGELQQAEAALDALEERDARSCATCGSWGTCFIQDSSITEWGDLRPDDFACNLWIARTEEGSENE